MGTEKDSNNKKTMTMFDFLKKKKRAVIAFPYDTEGMTYRIVMHELMEKKKLSAKDALGQIFSRGVEEMSKRIIEEYIITHGKEKREKAENTGDDEDEVRDMRSAKIGDNTIRLGYYTPAAKIIKEGRFNTKESARFIEGGYMYWKAEKSDTAAPSILLYNKWRPGVSQFHKRDNSFKGKKYIYLSFREGIASIEKILDLKIQKGKPIDVKYGISEGRECLVLTLKK